MGKRVEENWVRGGRGRGEGRREEKAMSAPRWARTRITECCETTTGGPAQELKRTAIVVKLVRLLATGRTAVALWSSKHMCSPQSTEQHEAPRKRKARERET